MAAKKTSAEVETLYLDALVAAGVSRDKAIQRLKMLEDKHPDIIGVPIGAVVNLLQELITPDHITRLLKLAAEDLAKFVQTGKGPVEKDPSALA